jgi:hypothetical protein
MKLIDVQTFTSDGVWNKPTNATKVSAVLIGGGGGGSGGQKAASFTTGGYQGSGGGVCLVIDYEAHLLPQTIDAIIGLGGTGGAGATTNSSSGGAGSDGGDTTFGIFRAIGSSGNDSSPSSTCNVISGSINNTGLKTVNTGGTNTLDFPGLATPGGIGGKTTVFATQVAGKGLLIATHSFVQSGTPAPAADNDGIDGGAFYIDILGGGIVPFGLGGSGGYTASGSVTCNGGNGGLFGGGGGGGAPGLNDVANGGNGGNGANGYIAVYSFEE